MYRNKYLLENRLLSLLLKKRNSAENDLLARLLNSNPDWVYILETAKTEDIFYPVYRELLFLDGQKNILTEEARDRFSQLYYAYISQSVLLSQQISLVLDKIEARGIKTLLLKGPAIDAVIYKENYLRPRLDLDLAVKKEKFPALEALLSDLGYSFDNETEKQYPIPEYLNSRLYTHKQSGFIPVHAHRQIINNLYLLALGDMDIDMDSVWQEAELYKEYNHIFCLKPEAHLLYICEHALKHDYERLIFLYEIDRFIDFYKDKFDWAKLVLLAQEFRLSFAVYYGLFFASRFFFTDIPVNILNVFRPKRISLGERIFVKCTLKRKRISCLSYLVYFAARKGYRAKITFLLRTVFPFQFTVTGYLQRIRRLTRLIFKC